MTDRATKESLLSATNSPRPSSQPTRIADRDPHAIDLAWVVGRARDWLLGPAPLVVNLSLFLFVGLGALLWRLSQNPDGFGLPGWLIVWGILVAVHTGVVVAWGTLRSWRSPRLGPVYYHAIPPEQRTVSRRTTAAQPIATRPSAPDAVRPTWQGVLAPVTPFPTLRGMDRAGTSLPPAPDQPDVTAIHQTSLPPDQDNQPRDEWPARAERDSALHDVRNILASDQPLWRRWRRRPVERPPLAEPPIDAGSSWLSPFPGARPVTRPAPVAPLFPAVNEAPGRPAPPATDRRWPAGAATGPAAAPAGRPASAEQIPSLAAMLRSSNLTSLSDAPIAPRPPQSPSQVSDDAPPPLPVPPTPFSRPPASAPARPGTVALFAAFGIDGDGKPDRAAEPNEPTDTQGAADPSRRATQTAPSGPPHRPKRP